MLHLTKDEVIDLLERGWAVDHPRARHLEDCAACAASVEHAVTRAELLGQAALRSEDGLGPVALRPLPPDTPGPLTAGRLSEREEEVLRRLAGPAPLVLLEREWPDLERGFHSELSKLRRRVRLDFPELLVETQRALSGALGEWSFIDAVDGPELDAPDARTIELIYPLGAGAMTFDAGAGPRSALAIDAQRADGKVGIRLLHLAAATLRMTGSRSCEEALLARRYGVVSVGLQRLLYSGEDDEHWDAVLERLLPGRRVELRYGERSFVPRALLPVEENGDVRCTLLIEAGKVSEPVRTTAKVTGSGVTRVAHDSRIPIAEGSSPDGDLFVVRAFLTDAGIAWEVTSADVLLVGRRVRLGVTTAQGFEELVLRLDRREEKAYARETKAMTLPILAVEIEELADS